MDIAAVWERKQESEPRSEIKKSDDTCKLEVLWE